MDKFNNGLILQYGDGNANTWVNFPIAHSCVLTVYSTVCQVLDTSCNATAYVQNITLTGLYVYGVRGNATNQVASYHRYFWLTIGT